MPATQIRRALAALGPDSDADLLRRFVDTRNEPAFAALVKRHGPLVLGVCRRVVPDSHLADDAFQAAFVVLARRAAGLDSSRPLGPWLYAVAHRVALRARTMIGRRRKRETLAAVVPDVHRHSPEVDDASAVLDDEIGKLPPATRDAVVLCELQGMSRREAAAKLGIAEGTLSSRLAAARKALAARLSARGVTLAVAAVAVPADLAAAAVRVGVGGAVPSVVASLSNGASAMTLLTKLKAVGVLAVLTTLVAAGGWGPWKGSETAAAPVPKELKQGDGLLWTLDPDAGKLIAYTPDGDEVKVVKLADKNFDPTHFHGITADGQHAMLAVKTGVVFHDEDTDPRGTPIFTVHLLPLHEPGKPISTGIDIHLTGATMADTVCTSADGEHLFRCREVTKPGAERGTWAVTRFDRSGKNPKEVALPEHRWLKAVLPGGDMLLEEYRPTELPKYLAYRFTPGGEKPELLSGEVDVEFPTLSPNGKALLATAIHTRPHTVPPDGEHRKLVVIDSNTGKPTRIDDKKGTASVWGCWSPDGKRVAMEWHERVEVPKKLGKPNWGRAGGGEVSVCNPDGTAGKVILKLDDPGDDHPGANFPRHRKHLLGWFPAQKVKAPVPPKAKDAGLIWTYAVKEQTLTAYTPDGKEEREVKLPKSETFLGVTPDGANILYATMANGAGKLTYHLRPLGEDTAGTDLKVDFSTLNSVVCWSRDGTRFIHVRHDDPLRPAVGVKFPVLGYEVVDITAKTVTPVAAPKNTYLLGWTADEKQFVGDTIPMGKDAARGTCLFKDGEKPTYPEWDESVKPFALTPAGDGKTLLGGGWKLADGEPYHAVYRLDPAAEKFTELFHAAGQNMTQAVPSPDGKQFAAVWIDYGTPGDDRRLTVGDADGRGAGTVTLRGVGVDVGLLRLLGWFPGHKIKAPVPKAKPPAAEKLDRVPDAPPELRKELAGWDEKYRHGSEEKFAELEKRADELAKEHTDAHDQARIWFEVAHVAAQSDIRKHAERVRKYAAKCLKISRDPLQRGTLYSYLASCEEVADGEFGVRRRKAADWLLTGYAELLAQELPDARPELPVGEKFTIVGDAPAEAKARHKHAAQVTAREQAEWVNEQISRRDTLVLCFRNFYEPHPKAHGHGPDGPDELRKLAEAKLPAADADTLMQRVLPK